MKYAVIYVYKDRPQIDIDSRQYDTQAEAIAECRRLMKAHPGLLRNAYYVPVMETTP